MTLKQTLRRAVWRAVALTVVPACWLVTHETMWQVKYGEAMWF